MVEGGCREDVEGKGMIKGRGCRVDVKGKGDGQAMVVHCHLH